MFAGLETDIVDSSVYQKTLKKFRKDHIRLPTFSELSNPSIINKKLKNKLCLIDSHSPDPLNLFRVHWYNGENQNRIIDIPLYVELPSDLTGVDAKIIVLLGNKFPIINAHKVLAAYGCLIPKLLTGQFDLSRDKAVWPSTGNYCRGGIAISRILGCRGLAVLPEGMSKERFDWLEKWITNKADIIRTPGSESNVKEIYDACNELAKDPTNVILNQFSEFANYITHRMVTGPALECVFNRANSDGSLRLAAYVASSGSGGTLAAGDYLKASLGAKIGVVEALQCPTILYNGYGDHNIQGIGDKHIPLIHNVFNTDFAIAVSEGATDSLNLLFNRKSGVEFLKQRKNISEEIIQYLPDLGLSAIANIIASIKLSKYLSLGPDEVVITVATDGGELYRTEGLSFEEASFDGKFNELNAAEIYGCYLGGVATDNLIELDRIGRERIFNLGYYTWVEQQGVSLADFDIRRKQKFWDDLTDYIGIWDQMISSFNLETGVEN